MNLTTHDNIKSLVFRNGGNQDMLESLRLSFRDNNCAGFVENDSVHICVAQDATFENLANLFAIHMPCEFENKIENAKVVANAWAMIQRLRKI